MKTALLNQAMARGFIDASVAAGAEHAVISPGSRNTPIIMALARLAAAGSLKVHTIIDERSAAFFALGLARMTGRPTLLSCTSGSAGAHYYPAIVEAERSRIPLIVVTADRPEELHGCGAPQTMDQQELFGSHVRRFWHVEAPVEECLASDDAARMRRLGAEAVASALGQTPGPVHVNMAFRKPLWSVEAAADAMPPDKIPAADLAPAARSEVEAWLDEVLKAERGVFVWGAGELGTSSQPYKARQVEVGRLLATLSSRLGWPILSDATAGLRGCEAVQGHVATGELLAQSERFRDLVRPDLIVRIGGEPTTGHLSAWLAEIGRGRTLLVDPSGWKRDPHRCAHGAATADPADFLSQLLERLREQEKPKNMPWLSLWTDADTLARKALASTCSGEELWAGSIACALGQALPGGTLLHLASSLAIRSMASFVPNTRHDATLTSNRGVNGVDGTLATALGQGAVWTDGPSAVLLGDVAFLHDLGSLASVADDKCFVVVVVDNEGGGIFDHLPISEAGQAFERHFITAPPVSPAQLAQGFPVPCREVETTTALRSALKEAFCSAGAGIVIAKVDRGLDLERHHATWALAASLINGSLPQEGSPEVSP